MASASDNQGQDRPTGHKSRALPTADINDGSMDDAYVQFILYCNPSIPDSVDTVELRRGFRSPPRSDGKSFSTYTLFNLIRRLESKELNTWTQLVLELGVEPPDPAKNQSTQKLAQYAVRLKRWLRAFHVDAFFQYCLGKGHSYYTDIPEQHKIEPDIVRDSVPPEEDLAIRALVPEWRPKRGRRKADEIDNESQSSSKRIHREASINSEGPTAFDDVYSANPQHSFSWSDHYGQPDPWTAATMAIAPKATAGPLAALPSSDPLFSSQQRSWRINDQDNAPFTPYPQSAVTPRHDQANTLPMDLPQSAHPHPNAPSIRARKRHGPAVSAAWQSSGSSSTGKLRGRPRNSRSIQMGPFSTFPVNPQTQETPTKGGNASAGVAPMEISRDVQTPLDPQSLPLPQFQSSVRKPSKLQLQVPQHSGGPVRLATPPRVLINGVGDRPASSTSFGHERRSSADFFNEIDDSLDDEIAESIDNDSDRVDWKRRALALKRKLQDKEEELQALRRRVLQAVM